LRHDSLPISYEDAIPILKQLQGKGIPAGDLGKEWVGGLGYYGVEYFTGPSEVDMHFVNEVNTVSETLVILLVSLRLPLIAGYANLE
jgi:hypothetical protein